MRRQHVVRECAPRHVDQHPKLAKVVAILSVRVILNSRLLKGGVKSQKQRPNSNKDGILCSKMDVCHSLELITGQAASVSRIGDNLGIVKVGFALGRMGPEIGVKFDGPAEM